MHQNQIEQAAVLACQGGSFHPLYWKLSQVEVMERILIYSMCVCVCVFRQNQTVLLYTTTPYVVPKLNGRDLSWSREHTLMSWCEMLEGENIGVWLGMRALTLPRRCLANAERSEGDKGLTDSKDRPGVGRVKGRASAETPRFMVSRTTGSGTEHCFGMWSFP